MLYQHSLDFYLFHPIVSGLTSCMCTLSCSDHHFVCLVLNTKYYYTMENWFSGKKGIFSISDVLRKWGDSYYKNRVSSMLTVEGFFKIFSKMTTLPDFMKMFEPETDVNLMYDFDKITLREKKTLIELVFARQCHLSDNHYTSFLLKEYFLSESGKVYREKLNDINFGLKGKMTFYEFRDLFVSFFYAWLMHSTYLKNMKITRV